MDVFSLEDDDGNELFITQSSNDDNATNGLSIIGDGNDFLSPCVSILDKSKGVSDQQHYEDISDDDFEIPSSQVVSEDDK